MESRSWAGRAYATYRKGGLRLVANVISSNRYLPSGLWHLDDIEVLRLDQLNRAALRPLGPDYSLRVAQLGDLPALARVARSADKRKGLAEIEAEVLAHAAAGARCAMALHRDRIIGYSWSFARSYPFEAGARALAMELDPGVSFIGFGFILPEFRLKGVFPHLLETLFEREPPGTGFYTAVQTINQRSLSSCLRLGFTKVGRLTCARVLGLPYRWTYRGEGGSRGSLGWAPARGNLAELAGARVTKPVEETGLGVRR